MKLECGQVWRTNYCICLLLKRVEENDPRDFHKNPEEYDCYALWEVFVIYSKYYLANKITNALIHPNAHERLA